MKSTTRRTILLVLVVAGVWFWSAMRPVSQPDGILAPQPPEITQPVATPPNLQREDFKFTALAGFRAKARVLSVKRYGGEREGRVSTLDLVLAWGRLSDTAQLKGVDVAQAERRVLFQSYDPSFPDAEMASHLINVHVIAGDAEIEKRLKELRVGNVVTIEGWLVEVIGSDGWRWKGEAREAVPVVPSTVFWVKQIEIAP